MASKNSDGKAQMKGVYIIRERGKQRIWIKVGVAFVNKDGSLAVLLDAIPIDGKLHIRDIEPKNGE